MGNALGHAPPVTTIPCEYALHVRETDSLFHWGSSDFWKCCASDTKIGTLALFDERYKMVCKKGYGVHAARAVHVQTICTPP